MDRKLLIEAWKRGAVTVGRGKKRPHEEERIIFGVPQKKDVHWSQDLNLITSDYSGVVEVGVIKALQKPAITIPQSNVNKMRPAFPGCSIGHFNISAGTFGAVVFRNGVKFILSNNHVLANSNDAEIGDLIYQPGPHDGGTVQDQIVTLHQFIPIRFMGEDSTCKFSQSTASTLNKAWSMAQRKTRFKAIAHTQIEDAVFNHTDCAIAMPLNPSDIGESVINIGPITGQGRAELGEYVCKSGRTTGLTEGEVIQVDVTTTVQYGSKVAIFENQKMSGPMSAGGDSGSAMLNDKNEIVGLLFAGSESVTIFNPIEAVFSALKVSI